DAFTEVLEVFKRDPARSALRRLHNGLRETMVHILGKSSLLARPFLQETFRALGALLLEFPSEAAVARPHLVDVGVLGASRVVQKLAIRSGSQRDDAQVHTQEVLGIGWRWLWRIHRHGQEEGSSPLPVEEVGLPTYPFQSAGCIGSEAERHFDSSIQGQQ